MNCSYRYIDSDAVLNECVAEWSRAEILALDTEFIRTDTFYPIPALIQVSDGGECCLIDPLAISDWNAFRQLMVASAPVKVLHSVSEDFEVFQRLLGELPRPLLDTQVGAGLAGMGAGMGYQRLVRAVLDIEVEKGETRSNWLQRPLSESQCNYAALDVIHLIPVYRAIHEALEAKGRLDWWWEEGKRQVRAAQQPLSPQAYYQRIKSGWRLSPQQQGRLQALAAWREQLARDQDVPRGRILKDPLCIEVAKRKPESVAALARIDGIGPGTVRRHGETICALVGEADSLEGDAILQGPPAGERKEQMKVLRAELDKISEQLQLPRELILRKRDMEETVRLSALPVELQGWRSEVFNVIMDEVFTTND